MKTEEKRNAIKKEVETAIRKQHKLTEEELAQISGGDTYTYWDAQCRNCGATIAGASGGELFTEEAAKSKATYYNNEGCPNCHQKGTMHACLVTVYW